MDSGDDRARPAGDLAPLVVVRPRAWRGRSQWYVAMGVLWVGLGVTGIVFVPGQWDNWFRVLFGLVWFFFAVSLRRWERVELGPDELRLVGPLGSRSTSWSDITEVKVNWGLSEYPIVHVRGGRKLKLGGYGQELAAELRRRAQHANPQQHT